MSVNEDTIGPSTKARPLPRLQPRVTRCGRPPLPPAGRPLPGGAGWANRSQPRLPLRPRARTGNGAGQTHPPRAQAARGPHDLGEGRLVMADGLAVWLHGLSGRLIDQERGRPGPAAPGGARRRLDGLLREGEARQAIANDLPLPRDDTFGLIRALGLDSAGAMVILPTAEPAPPPTTTLTA